MVPASAGTASVVLSQDVAVRTPGETHTVTATVTSADGQPAPDGTTVTFTVSGPHGAVTVGSPVVGVGLSSGATGGWLLRSDGTVTPFGTTPALTTPAAPAAPQISLA